MRYRKALVVLLCCAALPAWAADHLKLGLVKVANSGGTYIAVDKGYFAAEGIDPEIVFFEGGGVPIAVAVVSGDIDIGETATSGSLFSLAGQGALKIVSGETREARTFHNFGLFASNKGYENGLKSYTDLPGHSLAIPQIGSSAHYRLSLLAQKFGFDMAKVRLLAVQSIPNVLSTIKGGQADGTINAGTQMVPMVDAGDAKLIGWLSDEVRYQSAITFTSAKMTNQRGELLGRFLRALHKGFKDYHDAFTGPGEARQDGPTADATIALISKYTGEAPERTRLSIAYAPPDGGLDFADIVRQVDWFKSQGMLKGEVDGNAIIDKRYAIDLPVQ
jgi:NitT/TauT family transport system substrate-binding protein